MDLLPSLFPIGADPVSRHFSGGSFRLFTHNAARALDNWKPSQQPSRLVTIAGSSMTNRSVEALFVLLAGFVMTVAKLIPVLY